MPESHRSAESDAEELLVEHSNIHQDVPDIIAQTGADGRPLRRISETDSEVSAHASPSCASCFFRFFCCLSGEHAFVPLLPEQNALKKGRKCLVLDLDETLVHSSFEKIENADFTIKVHLEGKIFPIDVIKRPGVDEFLAEMGKHFEIVIFTASLPKYADKVVEILDTNNVVDARLFREHCTLHQGNFVKDLALLGRDLKNTIIIDNSPLSYQFQPQNAIGVSTFIDDEKDRELFYCKEFLLSILDADDVRVKLKTYKSFITELEQADSKGKPSVVDG